MPVLGLEPYNSQEAELLFEDVYNQTFKPLKTFIESFRLKTIQLSTLTDIKIHANILKDLPLENSQRETSNFLAAFKKMPIKCSRLYDYDKKNYTFFAMYSTVFSLNFNSKRGDNKIAFLFEIMWDCLTERGKIENNYKMVSITRTEIIKRLKDKGITNVDINWIKSTMNNLRSKIPSGYKDMLNISFYDPIIKGYCFKFKLPQE